MHSGFAAGCEARLCLAVKILKGIGLGPWFGLWPRWGRARTKGIAQIKMDQLTAGRSPASHPAAKPQHESQMIFVRIILTGSAK